MSVEHKVFSGSNSLLFEFGSNNELSIHGKSTMNHGSTDLYKTQYKVVVGQYDQCYVRIFKISPDLSRYNDAAYLKDSVDFQFLHSTPMDNMPGGERMILRNNSTNKINYSVENTFK